MLQVTKDNKKIYIEILRLLAAFLVVINHVYSPMFFFPKITDGWHACITLFFASKIAVPVFLMISGGLLLTKEDSMHKYFSRVVRWGCVIVLSTMVYHIYSSYDNIGGLVTFLEKIVGGATISHWYIFLYLGILVMLPILQKLAQELSKEQMRLFLVLTLVVGGIFPMISTFSKVRMSNEFLDVLFSPYLGMFFCGYYIEKYVDVTKKKAIASGIIYMVLLGVQVITTMYLYDLDNQNYLQMDNRIFPTITISAICVYILVKYIFESRTLPRYMNKAIVYGGSLTLGIFLSGDLFINFFYPYLKVYVGSVNIFILLMIYSLWIFLCCSVSTIILKKIPGMPKLL